MSRLGIEVQHPQQIDIRGKKEGRLVVEEFVVGSQGANEFVKLWILPESGGINARRLRVAFRLGALGLPAASASIRVFS